MQKGTGGPEKRLGKSGAGFGFAASGELGRVVSGSGSAAVLDHKLDPNIT